MTTARHDRYPAGGPGERRRPVMTMRTVSRTAQPWRPADSGRTMIAHPHSRRNAPNPRGRLSNLVDTATAAADDAQAAGMHVLATELHQIRMRAAELAMHLWRCEGRE